MFKVQGVKGVASSQSTAARGDQALFQAGIRAITIIKRLVMRVMKMKANMKTMEND